MSSSIASPAPAPGVDLSAAKILLMAVACGVIVANLYYAQTLIDVIGPEIGMSASVAGLITTLTQLGYGLGLFLIVPIADLFENRRIILGSIILTIAGCIGIALSSGPTSFLIASIVTGIGAIGAQVIVPLASHLATPEKQGRVVGTVMSGLLFGIMLARPIASFLAGSVGWRATFILSAVAMGIVAIALLAACPRRTPKGGMHYGEVLASTFAQLVQHRVVRMRAFYQAMMFAAFNLFWTAAPLALIHDFHLSHTGIGAFALAGAGGALIAPVAGWMADRKLTRPASLIGLAGLTVGFLLADWTVAAGSLIGFTIMAVLIDAAVQMSQITGQKLIFSLDPHARGRINAAYVTVMFVIGALGSVIGSATFEAGGWSASAMAGAAIGGIATLGFLLFDRSASIAR
ncbi:Predicted arabinose efflux permease, MFS family [Sphingobium sp. AP50]|uniref:MFS transporter n=1 Tax=Sphingobium sp. AP50 TaxID=1884369 RepID=UPI0008AE9BDC|nr:MFS transporter [Sphingobium sp. AP50]SEJ60556.1 Predicted arabinose efflux permease, MFS family [Sphingobium sp. AP50]SEJ70531.1 Predicted arabinose efflux permease, MFS family [Sphingobium sp. AP50]